MPPFLEKLRELCAECPSDAAGWSEDGLVFEVRDAQAFNRHMEAYFKGTLKTFVRQLHFYGFSKQDVGKGGWGFVHPEFTQDSFEDGIFNIKRKTRSKPIALASKDEVKDLRNEFKALKSLFTQEIENIGKKLERIQDLFEQRSATKEADEKNSAFKYCDSSRSASDTSSVSALTNGSEVEEELDPDFQSFKKQKLLEVQPSFDAPLEWMNFNENECFGLNTFNQSHMQSLEPLDDFLALPISGLSHLL